MKYALRNGKIVGKIDAQDKFLEKLYSSVVGCFFLKFLIKPFVSNLGGFFLNTKFSTFMIDSFIENNNIDMSQYEEKKYTSYNDFFTRKLKPGARNICMEPNALISPCDSKLTAYDIDEDSEFMIKGTSYTLNSLLRDSKLAKQYQGGKALVFRLTVDDYHRYIYIDNGLKSRNRSIPGVYHTVNPIANDKFPIYKENHREYTLIKTENFGKVIQMEVGALMVGKITNHHAISNVKRGEEKGYFEFGGSTIVMLFEKDSIVLDEDIARYSSLNIETKVECGSKIGRSV